MKNAFKNYKPAAVLVMLVIAVSAIAWQNKNSSTQKNSDAFSNGGDTTEPRKRNADKDDRVKDFDYEMRLLEKNMRQLEVEMRNLKLQHLDKLQEKMSKIDFSKMKEIECL
jgi:uncharacterized protein HemX